jgi:hypothetical protein
MSADEILIAALAAVLALAFWGGGLATAVQANPLVRSGRRLAAAVAALVVSLGVVLVALPTGADPQVRSGPVYIVLFLAVAADTLSLVTVAGSLFGLPVLGGFIRGKNGAVGWALAGLWLGTGLVNAGANVGRGDTIYTTLGPLGLALGALLALAAILSAATGGLRAIRLDRDMPAGVRAGGLFVAWGLILGRAVAGDWESAERTLADFVAYGWPVLALLIVAIPIELMLRPTVEKPVVNWPGGILPAAAYLGVAGVWAAIQ